MCCLSSNATAVSVFLGEQKLEAGRMALRFGDGPEAGGMALRFVVMVAFALL